MASPSKRPTFDQAFVQAVGAECRTDKTTHHGYVRFCPLFLAPLRRCKTLAIVEIGYGEGKSLPFSHLLIPTRACVLPGS
ncbi:hypothetical protein FB106_10178 [Synechococcus sp. Ace-Pa]|uniref:hypothetical protein n=1 Tax=Synechococcus sp. Ace-Pa TaxID=2572902 RepID=UPI000A8DDFDB|nr:hypothetical protein [Synechococcus sp. Ace-Pa]MCT0202477.1 hypothetical protein [Synechococcus sp. CS-603]MCT0247124.1 hypothetical protein [Synechococcus sp. CS-601]TWB96415.1 hypothetical protein FB106_10178 [Synechococcus sp. Ace-Pa]